MAASVSTFQRYEGVKECALLRKLMWPSCGMNYYTMPPDEAADAVKAFHPKIVIPYHYRGSDLWCVQKGWTGLNIEVRLLEWYPK